MTRRHRRQPTPYYVTEGNRLVGKFPVAIDALRTAHIWSREFARGTEVTAPNGLVARFDDKGTLSAEFAGLFLVDPRDHVTP